MTETVDRSPPRSSTALALTAAALATVVVGLAVPLAVPICALGVGALIWALRSGSRRGTTVAGALLFAGALAAGSAGASTGLVLVAGALAVVSWDAADNGIGLGEQVGADARTRSAAITHVAATTVVSFGTAGVAYLLYAATTGGRPLLSLVALGFAAVVLTSALRVQPTGSDAGEL